MKSVVFAAVVLASSVSAFADVDCRGMGLQRTSSNYEFSFSGFGTPPNAVLRIDAAKGVNLNWISDRSVYSSGVNGYEVSSSDNWNTAVVCHQGFAGCTKEADLKCVASNEANVARIDF